MHKFIPKLLVATSSLLFITACTNAPIATNKTQQQPKHTLAKAVDKNVRVFNHGDNITLLLPTDSFFYPASSAIKPESLPIFAQIAQLLKIKGRNKIYVLAYTDDMQQGAIGKKLTSAQAHNIASLLWAEGIDRKRLVIKGYGSQHKLSSSNTLDARALNRHITISSNTYGQ